jgi:hypothetical protein
MFGYFLYHCGKLTAMSRTLERIIRIIEQNGWTEEQYEIQDINGDEIKL